MTFWIIATGAALILAFFLFRTLVSPLPQDENETQLAIYKDQLSEIERDEARGTLTQDEAKRLRTEVSRRILSADDAQKVAPKSMSPTEVAVVVAIVLVTLLGGGLWTYSSLGVPGYDDLPRAERFARHAGDDGPRHRRPYPNVGVLLRPVRAWREQAPRESRRPGLEPPALPHVLRGD